jgi:hypothetical protein
MIFVDTNVVVDLTGPDQLWRDWSLDHLAEALEHGPALINAVVFAELAPGHPSADKLSEYLSDLRLAVEPMPRPALFRAGQVFAEYRRSGGPKLNVLADFFVGAHAEFLEVPLLTRDTRRYRTYFPTLELIAP